jgi:hypothetical protein
VLVFDAFTATTAGAGRIASAPCTSGFANPFCEEFDPVYLASGALTYIIQRSSRSGTATASLVAWQAGHRTTLLSLPAVARVRPTSGVGMIRFPVLRYGPS